MLPPTLGTRVLSAFTWTCLTKLTFYWIEMAAVFTYPVASSSSYSFNRSRSRVPLSEIKESLLDRSATNANQGCFDACASMIKKDDRQYSERENMSREKMKTKKRYKNTCHSC